MSSATLRFTNPHNIHSNPGHTHTTERIDLPQTAIKRLSREQIQRVHCRCKHFINFKYRLNRGRGGEIYFSFKTDKIESTCRRMTENKNWGEGLERLMMWSIIWKTYEEAGGRHLHAPRWLRVSGLYWWCDRSWKTRLKCTELHVCTHSAECSWVNWIPGEWNVKS